MTLVNFARHDCQHFALVIAKKPRGISSVGESVSECQSVLFSEIATFFRANTTISRERMTAEDDRTIVERVLAGDKTAFGELIERNSVAALAFARRLLGRPNAEDAVQEAFLAAFLKLENLRDHDRFRAWLFGILANVCRSRLRLLREGYFHDVVGGQAIVGVRLGDFEPSAQAVFETRELHSLIFKAIEALPEELREATKLHYVQGLKLSEIAILTGSPIGTLKARLHHARGRLRDSLMSDLLVKPKQIIERGSAMIEVIVLDVATRAATSGEVKWAEGKGLGTLRVILLKETSGLRILPIWVGPIEGDVIAMQLEHIESPRPTTFDLTTRLLALGNTKLEKVAVTALRENTYFATMWINANGEVHEVDARPSDAITLALQADAPIFIAPETLTGNKSLVTADNELMQLNEQWTKLEREGHTDPEPQPMEWKSVRSLARDYLLESKAAPKSDASGQT
jgi:RNA polymerase sigma factor (sigma-70 family)